MNSCHDRRRSFALVACIMALVLWFDLRAGAQSLQDYFTNRITVTNLTGQFTQNNSNATFEINEPNHGGKTGGHSLWISWVAVSNGIVTFKTETSGFDTLLSAYQFTTTNGATFADLREVARADDSEGFEHESEIEFGVVAGQRFEVAVDGYFGAVGQIDFQWEFKNLALPPPIILTTLADRSVNIGDAVSLAFAVTNAGAGSFRWFRNGQELDGITTTNLDIASFSVTNVGRYKMRVSVGGGVQYFSVPVEIQINTDGAANTLAQGKLLDAPSSPLIGLAGDGLLRLVRKSFTGVVRGYNGSQIFNTTYAVIDTNEPPHCGVASGKSYWLLYQPPTNGTVTLDTLGSTYDTVMEAYTYNGTLTGYQDLISLDCANDSFTTNNAARIILPVAKSRQYLLVVAGVNGASGTAWLNYSLNTNQLPQPPSLTSTPPLQTVSAGSTVVLTAPVTGAPPMVFSWRKDGVLLPGQTSSSLVLSAVTSGQSGSYSFTVTNDMGSATGAFALKVVVPTLCKLAPVSFGLQLSYFTVVGQVYTVEECTNFLTGWISWPGSLVGNGLTNYFNVPNDGKKFYRIRIE